MAILGEAWVVLRAITDKLHGDVQKGLDDAGKDADKPGNSIGQKFASALSAGVKNKLEEDFGTQLFEGMNTGASDDEVQKFGDNKAKVLATGFGSGLKNIFKDIGQNTKDLIDTSVKDSDVQKSGDSKGRGWARGFFSGIGNIFKDIGENTKDLINTSVKDSDVKTSGETKGRGWVGGFKDGISNGLSTLKGALVGEIKSIFPDRGFEDDGKHKGAEWVAGFASGIGSTMQKLGTSLLSALTPVLTIAGMAGLIGSAVGAVGDLVGGLVALVAVLGQVSAAMGVVAAGGLAAMVEGLVLGKMWLTDLTDSAKKVPPAAAAARAEFQKFTGDFKNMVAQVGQETVFPALKDLFSQLNTMMPLLRTGITQMGQAFAGVIGSFKTLFANPLFQGNLATVMKTNADVFGSFGKGLASLVGAFVALLAAASPLIEKFATWFQGWAQHIQDITTAGQQTGKLGDFFTKAGQQASVFFDWLKQLGGVLGAVVKAALPMGQALLAGWDQGAKSLNEYLHSAEGVQALGNFFDPNGQMRQNLSAIGGLITPLIKDIAELAQQPGIAQLAQGIQAVLPGVTSVLKDAINAVGALGQSLGENLITPAGMQGVKDLGQGVKDLGRALQNLTPAVGPLLSVVGQLVSSFVNGLAPALTVLAPALTGMIQPAQQIGDSLGRVLGSAISSLVPPITSLVQMIGQLASAFGGPLSSSVNVVAGTLKLLLPVLQVLVSVVSALAPEIVALGTAFAIFKVTSALGDGVKSLAGGLESAGLKAAYAAEQLSGGAASSGKFLGAIGGLSGGLGKLAESLPVIGLVIGVGIAFGQLASQMIAAGNAETAVKINTDGVTAALQASKGAIDGNVQSAAVLEAQQSGLLDQAKNWGVSQDTVVQALLNNKGALDQVHTGIDAYGKVLQLTSAPMSDAVDLNKNFGTALDGAAKKTQAVITAQEQVAGAIAQANGPAETNSTRIQGIATSAGNASTQLGNLKTALSNLTSDTTTVAGANAAFQVSLQTLAGTMAQYKGQALTANDVLNATSPAAAAAEQGLAGLAGNYRDVVSGMEKAGDSTVQVQAKQLQLRDTFIKAAEGAGLDATNAGQLADALLGIPDKVNAEVTADTQSADNNLDGVKDKLETTNGTIAKPGVIVDPTQANSVFGVIANNMAGLNGLEATSFANLNNAPFDGVYGNVMANIATLDNTTGVPKVGMDPTAFDAANYNILGDLTHLDGSKGTPTAGLNPGPFNLAASGVLASLGNLDGQHPDPTISARDAASSVIGGVAASLANLHDKTVNVYVRQNDIGVTGAGTGGRATGGEIDQNQWTTVGEHGRELIFTTRGQFVATYQQAQTILAAARAQAGQAVNGPTASGSGAVAILDGGSSGGVSVTNNIFPSAGMDERALAQTVGNEVAYTLKRV